MARTISDNPGGWSRSLPSHTVEFDANYAAPWVSVYDIVIAAAANYVHVFTIPDDGMIYFVDTACANPRAATALSANISFNNVRYFYFSDIGYVNIPVRQNPSLQFVYGDHIDFQVSNRDIADHQFNIILNGTKIPMPPGYTHGPF